MLPILMGSIFFPLIVALSGNGFFYIETYSTVQKLIFDNTEQYQHTKDVCPFITHCVTEFKTVFYGLIFWRVLVLPPVAPNKNTRQI